jgi:hypothetical protein
MGDHAAAPGSRHAHHGAATVITGDGEVTLGVGAPTWPMLSARAREQVAAVEQAVAQLDTPARARAAGFRPALGMIPTMGVHWVHQRRMTEPVTLLQPANLLFSKVDGEERLVGVAYAFIGESAEEAPDLFDGRHDVWHDHPEFAPPGQTLVMLHLWFVPSPHGPFAGHNPWLAYWGAGLEPPPAAMLHDHASARRVHGLALALAEHVEPMQFARMLQLDSAAQAEIAHRRAAIGSAIPRLAQAQRAGDMPRWTHEADTAIAEWRHVRDLYLAAVPMPRARELLAQLYQEMESGHGAH